MTEKNRQISSNINQCVDQIIAVVGKQLVVGTPLGLGKANLLLNALYRRAVKDSNLQLTIFTALTLQKPVASSGLESRFLGPLFERWFDGYPELEYATARSRGTLPPNVRVQEFFFVPGSLLNNPAAQRDYISSNYTHVARDMLSRGVNVVLQMVSPGGNERPGRVSLSCNPDVTLELIPKMRVAGRPMIAVGEMNEALPYLYGDADVEAGFFDLLYAPPEKSYRLFGMPKSPIATTDYAIGLHASALVKDEGTLQIGIGSLGDAVAYCLGVRHEDNSLYQQLINSASTPQTLEVQRQTGELGIFEKGLYGATEMFVDGFLFLFDKGILKRKVYDDVNVQALLNNGLIGETITADTLDALEEHGAFDYPLRPDTASYLRNIGVLRSVCQVSASTLSCESQSIALGSTRSVMRDWLCLHALGERLANPAVLHGGFFLGNGPFYERLHQLSETERGLLKMTSVARINQLYRGEEMDRLQRLRARFINTCLMVTLNGAVVSDGLDDARVLSGVGGQYNFVAMAHALDDSRSIIKLRSTWQSSKGLRSNIVFSYANATIPRHLRDIVITEYGSADLRGRTDSECAAALINIADSRFQKQLLAEAKQHGKLPRDYQIDAEYQNNNPEKIEEVLSTYRQRGLFQPFPLGTQMSDDEIHIGAALKRLAAQASTTRGKIRLLPGILFNGSTQGKGELLARLELDQTKGIKEKLLQRLVASFL